MKVSKGDDAKIANEDKAGETSAVTFTREGAGATPPPAGGGGLAPPPPSPTRPVGLAILPSVPRTAPPIPMPATVKCSTTFAARR